MAGQPLTAGSDLLPVMQPNKAFKKKRRDKKSRWFIKRMRVGVLISLNLLILSHLLLSKLGWVEEGHSDPTDIYLFLETGRVKIVAVLFFTWLLTVPILGRAGCGWFCHMGAWQEFFAWLMGKIGIYRHKAVHTRWFRWVIPAIFPFFFLLAVGASWWENGPLSQGIHYDASQDAYPVWEFNTAATLFFILPILTLPVMLLGTRAICRYTCPFALYFRVLEKISLRKIAKVGHCNNCEKCSTDCMMGIDVMGQVQTYGYVKDIECIKCMTCVQTCPTEALSYEKLSRKERRVLTAAAPPPESVPLYQREFMSPGSELYLFAIVLFGTIKIGGNYDHMMLIAPWGIGMGLLAVLLFRKAGIGRLAASLAQKVRARLSVRSSL